MKWNESTVNSLCVSLNVLGELHRHRWDVRQQFGIQRAPLTCIDTLLLEDAIAKVIMFLFCYPISVLLLENCCSEGTVSGSARGL